MHAGRQLLIAKPRVMERSERKEVAAAKGMATSTRRVVLGVFWLATTGWHSHAKAPAMSAGLDKRPLLKHRLVVQPPPPAILPQPPAPILALNNLTPVRGRSLI